MKSAMLFATALASKTVVAGSVLWGVLSMDPASSGEDSFLMPSGGIPISVASGGAVYPNAWITVSEEDGIVTITGDPRRLVTAGGDSWSRTGHGELVDASTTRNPGSSFLHGWLDGQEDDWDLRADDPVVAEADSVFSFYLGFATASSLNEGNPRYEWSDVYYGWALFEYSGGTLRLVDSAIDVDGCGIYAGTGTTTPVPEPSSACLAALGALAVFSRKRRPGKNG